MHETNTLPVEEPKPPRFRFSLWTLFGVMTLVCMLLATPGVMLAIFALVVAAEIAAICFAAFISWPVCRLIDGVSALIERRKITPEDDLAAMTHDERFGERRKLFQPPSVMS